jgi:hypothetical protein
MKLNDARYYEQLREVFAQSDGYCLVLVQSEKQAGEIRLKAVSGNLKGSEVIIKTE